LKLPVTFYANFSPYHDPDPVSDFYDDSAQRITSVVAAVFAVHIVMFFMMSPNFIMPDMKEKPPEAISVEIITLEAEPEAPPPTPPKPVTPKPPEPKPEPVQERQPLPADFIPPEINFSEPPPPQQAIEPLPETFQPPEIITPPVLTPDPLPAQTPQPEPQPIIEFYEPRFIPRPHLRQNHCLSQ